MEKILVVDDEPELLRHLRVAAEGEGREVITADSAGKAIDLINKCNIAVVVTDLKMETDLAGLDVLRAAKEKDIYTQVIVATYWGKPEVSVEVMRLGAFDYIERDAPNTNIMFMIGKKIELALEFREAKLRGKTYYEQGEKV